MGGGARRTLSSPPQSSLSLLPNTDAPSESPPFKSYLEQTLPPSCPLCLAEADHVCWPYALIQALLSSSLGLGLGSREEVIPLYFSGYPSSGRRWPKQQWRAPRAFFSAVNSMPSIVHIALLLASHIRFPVPTLSKRYGRMRLTTRWQAAFRIKSCKVAVIIPVRSTCFSIMSYSTPYHTNL